MRRFGLLLAWLLVGLPVFPQIYRVGGITLSSLDALSGPSWEVGAGVFASTATLHVEKGEDAFRGASALKKVTIPASVERIGVGAFRETALESASFATTQGWVAGGRSLAEESLANASTAATYLTDAYVADEWTRK